MQAGEVQLSHNQVVRLSRSKGEIELTRKATCALRKSYAKYYRK
jgi:hypothetical protein